MLYLNFFFIIIIIIIILFLFLLLLELFILGYIYIYIYLFTNRRIPKTWKKANMVLFFKKGNIKAIKNYRPICLLSNMYKLFTKIVTTRLEMKINLENKQDLGASTLRQITYMP